MHDLAGLLSLNKPAGLTSRQALDRVARLARGVKMGHAGTLDPMASGVLVLCLGRATRLISYVQRMPKHYTAGLTLGQQSPTHDLESPVEAVAHEPVHRAAFEGCLRRFRGDIWQVPPEFSAVHVGGRRAYELARQGKHVELQPRQIRVDEIECTNFNYPTAELRIRCSSGTYVRSLVRDIGKELDCGAVMTSLVRTAIGPFQLDRAAALDQLHRGSIAELLHPPLAALPDLPIVTVPESLHREVAHGRSIRVDTWVGNGESEVALCDESTSLLAVAHVTTTGELHPRIVLADQQRT